ncbi:MAG: hypothetical protein ACOX8V_05195 [Thermoleophilia bacterium]|jgi:hypothetical protein
MPVVEARSLGDNMRAGCAALGPGGAGNEAMIDRVDVVEEVIGMATVTVSQSPMGGTHTAEYGTI